MLTEYRAGNTIDKYITYLPDVQTRFTVAGETRNSRLLYIVFVVKIKTLYIVVFCFI